MCETAVLGRDKATAVVSSALRLKNQASQRRQCKGERLLVAVRWYRFGNDHAGIADVAACIQFGIAVEALPIFACQRHPETVAVTHDRGHVENTDKMPP